MSNQNDMLLPENSPHKTGVRRVNNVPLLIVFGIAAIFVSLILFVAIKRSHEEVSSPKPSTLSKNTDTTALAAQVVGGHASGIIPSVNKPDANKIAVPIAKVGSMNTPPLPPRLELPASMSEDPQLASIQRAKFQEFKQAVNAKTKVSMPEQTNNYQTDSKESQNSAQNDSSSSNSSEDMNKSYQEQLQKIRQRINGGISGSGKEGQKLIQNNDIHQFDNSAKKDRWRLDSSMQAPATPYELRAGAVVPGQMIGGINSDLPGTIRGQVSENVYDTATGKYLLIPAGTQLYGTYSSHIIYGQSAVLVAWQRMVFPDGKALDIGAMSGTDSAGYSGFRDQVDNHYFRIFGSAFLMSGIVAGISYSQGKSNPSGNEFTQPSMSSELSQSLGQEVGQVAAQMIAKNLNISPTLKIRPGYPFNIIVTKDIVFNKPYQSFDYQV